MQNSCLELIDAIANMQEDFVVIFKEEDIIFTNRAFNTFFGVSSLKEYKRNFGAFINNFVPHPSYFNANKVGEGQTWFEAIGELEEVDRVVSFLSQNHDPHAYSVSINEEVEDFKIVTFKDITQTLIKRIMIENNASIDIKSGAYAKQYFLQIKQSYEDASIFNEKIVGLTLMELLSKEDLEESLIQEFVFALKNATRDDDMLVKWSKNSFLLAYLVDDDKKAQAVALKLQMMINRYANGKFSAELTSVIQKEDESIARLLNRLSDSI